jgi:hypothetical protein
MGSREVGCQGQGVSGGLGPPVPPLQEFRFNPGVFCSRMRTRIQAKRVASDETTL